MALGILVAEGGTGKKWSLWSSSILKMTFMLDKVNLQEVGAIGTKVDDLRGRWCMESMRDGGNGASVVVDYLRDPE